MTTLVVEVAQYKTHEQSSSITLTVSCEINRGFQTMRQRFGESYFVPELKIWDRQADGRTQVLLELLRN